MSPPLDSVMSFMTKESEKDDAERDKTGYAKALNYLTQHLGPGGLYERDFSRYDEYSCKYFLVMNLPVFAQYSHCFVSNPYLGIEAVRFYLVSDKTWNLVKC